MSNNNWKDIAITISVVAGLIILWLVSDRKNLIANIQSLEKEIDANESLNEEIKRRLRDLVHSDEESDLDADTKNELIAIAALIEINQETKALSALAKIIENLLKKLYKNDEGFKTEFSKQKRKTPTFHDYLEYAHKTGLINKEDYHLVSVLKIIRNEEAHELNVQKEQSRIVSTFITGLGIVMLLTKKLKGLKTTIETNIKAVNPANSDIAPST